jgi:DNA invertase Pin-like site-specific DNA recombinase
VRAGRAGVALYLASREPDGCAVVGQEIRLRTYLLGRPDWRPVAEDHDYGYYDGLRPVRPALRRALADARTGRFDVLLVARLDRLGRNLTAVAALLVDLHRAGVAVVTADDAVDTTRPHGRFLLAVLAAAAEFDAALRDHPGDPTGPRRRRRRVRRSADRQSHGCG